MILVGAFLLTGTLVASARKLHANNSTPRKVCILIQVLVASAKLTARRHFYSVSGDRYKASGYLSSTKKVRRFSFCHPVNVRRRCQSLIELTTVINCMPTAKPVLSLYFSCVFDTYLFLLLLFIFFLVKCPYVICVLRTYIKLQVESHRAEVVKEGKTAKNEICSSSLLRRDSHSCRG